MKTALRKEKKKTRQHRARKKLVGTEERPRLHLHRTHLHLYAQAINDIEERTLLTSSTLNPELRKRGKSQWGNVEAAKEFGKHMAEALKQNKIGKIIFDRGGLPYQGRIRAFVETLREGGIQV